MCDSVYKIASVKHNKQMLAKEMFTVEDISFVIIMV